MKFLTGVVEQGFGEGLDLRNVLHAGDKLGTAIMARFTGESAGCVRLRGAALIVCSALVTCAVVMAAVMTSSVAVRADTLTGALANAYQNNPQLNSQRAVVRQTDEQVPQALSGYKPTVSATASFGQEYTSTLSKATT